MRNLILVALFAATGCIVINNVGSEKDAGASDAGTPTDAGSDGGSCNGVPLCAVDSPLEENQLCSSVGAMCETSACCSDPCSANCYQFVCTTGRDPTWKSLEQQSVTDSACFCDAGNPGSVGSPCAPGAGACGQGLTCTNGTCQDTAGICSSPTDGGTCQHVPDPSGPCDDAGTCGAGSVCIQGNCFGCLGPSADAGWSLVPSGTTADLRSVWGTDTEAWAVGIGGAILHWDGASWSAQNSGVTNDLYGVWGSSTSDVWAVAHTDMLVHWDGSSWTPMPMPINSIVDLDAVSGSASDDVWAVGTHQGVAVAMHWDGGNWSFTDTSPLDAGTLLGVWDTVPNLVEAVTDGTLAAQWNGSNWAGASVAPNLPQRLTGGVNGVWVTTVDGGLYSHVGGQWGLQPTGVTSDLNAVWVFPGGDAWAIGDQGAVTHSVSGSASPVSGLTAQNLHGIWGTPAQALWAVGDHGTILHYQPAGSPCGSTFCGANEVCVVPCCGGANTDAGCTPPPPFCAVPPGACVGNLSCGCFGPSADPCQTFGTCGFTQGNTVECVCA